MNALLRTLIVCRSNLYFLLVIRFFLGDIPAGGTASFVMIIPQRPVGFDICSPHCPFPVGSKTVSTTKKLLMEIYRAKCAKVRLPGVCARGQKRFQQQKNPYASLPIGIRPLASSRAGYSRCSAYSNGDKVSGNEMAGREIAFNRKKSRMGFYCSIRRVSYETGAELAVANCII